MQIVVLTVVGALCVGCARYGLEDAAGGVPPAGGNQEAPGAGGDADGIPAVFVGKVRSGRLLMQTETDIQDTIQTVDPAHSALFFSAAVDATAPSTGHIRGVLEDGTTVRFSRLQGGTSATIDYFVVDLGPTATVQRGELCFEGPANPSWTCPGGGPSLDPISLALSPITVAESLPLVSHSIFGSRFDADDWARPTLAADTLSVYFGPNGQGGRLAWQVVSLPGIDVTSGTVSLPLASSTHTETLASPAGAAPWLHATWEVTTEDERVGPNQLDARMLSTSQLELARQNTGTPLDVTWYLTSLGQLAHVQDGSTTLDASSTSGTQPISQVALDRSFVVLSGLHQSGVTPYYGDSLDTCANNPGVAWLAVSFESTASLAFERALTCNEPVTVHWTVIELQY